MVDRLHHMHIFFHIWTQECALKIFYPSYFSNEWVYQQTIPPIRHKRKRNDHSSVVSVHPVFAKLSTVSERAHFIQFARALSWFCETFSRIYCVVFHKHTAHSPYATSIRSPMFAVLNSRSSNIEMQSAKAPELIMSRVETCYKQAMQAGVWANSSTQLTWNPSYLRQQEGKNRINKININENSFSCLIYDLRPTAELHFAALIVERKPGDVDFAGWFKNSRRHIQTRAVTTNDHVCRIRSVEALVRTSKKKRNEEINLINLMCQRMLVTRTHARMMCHQFWAEISNEVKFVLLCETLRMLFFHLIRESINISRILAPHIIHILPYDAHMFAVSERQQKECHICIHKAALFNVKTGRERERPRKKSSFLNYKKNCSTEPAVQRAFSRWWKRLWN